MMLALAIHCTVDGLALAASREESGLERPIPGRLDDVRHLRS